MTDSEKKPVIDKFPKEQRTFETRVKFVRDVFSSKYSESQIMASCAQYKLGRSYDAYVKSIDDSLWKLHGEDPMKILKNIDDD